MDKSREIGKITEALSKAQGAMAMAKKKEENPFFKSRYSDLAAVWEVARKPLADNGLAVVQGTSVENGQVIVSTILSHSSGEYFESELALAPTKNDPQGVGSAITYGRRYSLSAMLGIASEEDDDGNAASGNKVGKKVQEPPTSATEPNSIKGGTCLLHNVQFFKAGKMKAFAHKLEDGSWCNMPEPTKTTPEQHQQNVKDVYDERIPESQTASKINENTSEAAGAVSTTTQGAPKVGDEQAKREAWDKINGLVNKKHVSENVIITAKLVALKLGKTLDELKDPGVKAGITLDQLNAVLDEWK